MDMATCTLGIGVLQDSANIYPLSVFSLPLCVSVSLLLYLSFYFGCDISPMMSSGVWYATAGHHHFGFVGHCVFIRVSDFN